VTDRDRVKLLFGPYQAPALRRGDTAFCLLRECDVVITSWSAGRIPWPRCRPADNYHGGGAGLLLDEELARAVRHESEAAVCYWWGVDGGVVWRWRKALGVTRTSCEGSRRLIRAAARAGGEACRGRPRRRRRRERGDPPLPRPAAGLPTEPWSAEEDDLVRTLRPKEAAARTGRSLSAVYSRRLELGLPDGRATNGRRPGVGKTGRR
jgi:hypothetical protein